MTKVKKQRNFTQTQLSILSVGLVVLAFILGNSISGGGFLLDWQKNTQPIQLEPENTFTPAPTPIPTLIPTLQPTPVPKQKNYSEEKLREIERINQRIELLLGFVADQIELQKIMFNSFHECEKKQDLTCMQIALKQIDSDKEEIDQFNAEIQNLELQRSILQSGL